MTDVAWITFVAYSDDPDPDRSYLPKFATAYTDSGYRFVIAPDNPVTSVILPTKRALDLLDAMIEQEKIWVGVTSDRDVLDRYDQGANLDPHSEEFQDDMDVVSEEPIGEENLEKLRAMRERLAEHRTRGPAG